MQEGLVVLEVDIELGLLFFYQVTLQKESFQFIIGQDVIQILDVFLENLGFPIESARNLKIGTDPVLETLGFANVDDCLV